MLDNFTPPKITFDHETLLDLFSGETEIDLLAQTLSPDIALRLMENFPGFDIKIPKKIGWAHPISQAIGLEDAKLVADYFEGGAMYVPSNNAVNKAIFRLQVEAMVRDGVPRVIIARSLGITDRNLLPLIKELGLKQKAPVFCLIKWRERELERKSNGS